MSKNEKKSRSKKDDPVYIGDGKFLFHGKTNPCYVALLGSSYSWLQNRLDGDVALCLITDEEKNRALAMMGVSPSPRYTPEMVEAANASLAAAGALTLARVPGALQLAMAGEGLMTLSSAAASATLTALARAAATLAGGVAGGAVITALFHSTKVGEGSDRVPGRDVAAMFAMPVTTLFPNRQGPDMGLQTADLPVRGSLVVSNGELALKLLKTGAGGLPPAVPVLTAVRDAATGLDKITLPAMPGQPSRTILVNPAIVPTSPSNTGNSASVPVAPSHTGTSIKPVAPIRVTTTPAADPSGMYDFIYWQLSANGSSVEPVYVMLSDPLDTGRYTRRQLDRKYKHAGDFGVTSPKKNTQTLTQFRDAIEAHLRDKATVERGTYRRNKGSKAYFNPRTMNVVVLTKNGDFLSGWTITPEIDNGKIYIETGVL